MTERNIAAEVLEGLREVREHRAGKRTLKTVRVEPRPLPKLTPEVIRSVRDRLGVSRAVFARMIRVPIRTVERWEQGRSSPPNQPWPSSAGDLRRPPCSATRSWRSAGCPEVGAI